MTESGRLLPYLLASAVLFLAPGPSVILAVSRGVAFGRGAALVAVIGNTLGLATQLLVVLLGPGLLVDSHGVFTVLKLLGAAYLVLLGVTGLRERRALEGALDVTKLAPARSGRLIRDGYIIGLTNPKGLITFTSLAPSALSSSGHPAVGALALLGVAGLAMAFLADAAWGLASASARTWFGASPDRVAALGLAGAILMIGFGIGLGVLVLA